MGGRLLSHEQISHCRPSSGTHQTFPFKRQDLQDFHKVATMPKQVNLGKAIAITFTIITVFAIAGIVTMVALYKVQMRDIVPTLKPTLATTTPEPPPVMRLPKNLIPHSYRIILKPFLYTHIPEVVNATSVPQSMHFEGNSTVIFHCVKTTETIYLHSRNLTIKGSAVVTNTKSNERLNVIEMIQNQKENDFLEILLEQQLKEGEDYSLFLDFEGEISNDLDGLYVSTYHEGNPYDGDTNTERFLVATKLEATNARSVFPCFDEPEMKAMFNLTIIHREDTIALANENVKTESNLDETWHYTTFYPTARMSTYLFAFTISEFTPITSPYERVEIQTFARPEVTTARHTEYAANITGQILKFYEVLFNLNYQQRTLDQFALPDSGPAGMENWGLITYRETAILYEEGVSSPLDKQAVALLIAQELAHQWFGNLVTMKWWNQIWLNKGFATYMSWFAVNDIEPEFEMRDMFVMDNLHAAFEIDSLYSSHPLNPPEEDVETMSEINEMFDDITYKKGAAILRMLADFIGENTFFKGVETYLSDFIYNNTEQKDLWNHMQTAVNEHVDLYNIVEMMDSWTNQIGYPVITINTANGEIYQKHFLFEHSSDSRLWWHIPIRLMSGKSGSSLISLSTNIKERKKELISENEEWILANVNCVGYYRVNYNPENWKRLLDQLETDQERIPLKNRGQLIDDAFNLARAKLVSVTLALNSTRFLRYETEYIPWESAIRNLEYFLLMFDRSEVYGPMQAFYRLQVQNLYNFFSNYTDNSKVPEDPSLQRSQINAIKMACSNRLPECIEMATNMFGIWMTNGTNPTVHPATSQKPSQEQSNMSSDEELKGLTRPSNSTPNSIRHKGAGHHSIHPNLRSEIYCQAVGDGGLKEWEFVWKQFRNCNNTSERERLRRALSCTRESWLLSRYMEYTLDPEIIPLTDVASTINYVTQNVVGHAMAWNFIRANWEYVSQRGAGMLIQGVTSRFSTEFELEELERFAADHNLESIGVMMHAIEQTRVNIQWVEEEKDIILNWFERETSW